MDAISCWQPYATLIALGEKKIETRDWPMPAKLIGPWVAIHGTVYLDRMCWRNDPLVAVLAGHGITAGNATGGPGSLPMRSIVALVKFTGCSTTDYEGLEITKQERALGDYGPGRWAWHIGDRVNLNHCPVSMAGRQRIWTLTNNQLQQVQRAVQRSGWKTLPDDLPFQLGAAAGG